MSGKKKKCYTELTIYNARFIAKGSIIMLFPFGLYNKEFGPSGRIFSENDKNQ